MARDDNEVKYKGMKLEGKGFSKKRRSGMRSSHDYIMAKRLGLGRFAYRRISCFCAPCRDHLDLPFDERFSGSANECILAPMMQMRNKKGEVLRETYNDWHIAHLEERKDSKKEEYFQCIADTMQELGKNMSNQVHAGNFCAYWYVIFYFIHKYCTIFTSLLAA